MKNNSLRSLIREILKEEAGEVTVTTGTRSSDSGGGGIVSSISNWLFGDADKSKEDEELLDEDELEDCDEIDEAEAMPGRRPKYFKRRSSRR